MIFLACGVDNHAAIVVGVDGDLDRKSHRKQQKRQDQGFAHQNLYKNDMWNQYNTLFLIHKK